MTPHYIRSRVEPGKLLHVVLFRGPYEGYGRRDISQPTDGLQVAVIDAKPGQYFKPHYHIPKACPTQMLTNELWSCGYGSVVVGYYDLPKQDGKSDLIEHVGLIAGDWSITYAGGHDYRVGINGGQFVEVKGGPYWGQALDKVWL